MAKLTSTSYVVLALLARRPYSAYELTTELKASLSQCMPRSETLLYREPKNLVARGLAVVDVQLKGRQKRAVYSITEAGRDELAEWFKQPAASPIFEYEAIVRLTFGHLGEREDLIAGLAELERQVGALAHANVEAMAGWFDRFPPPAEHIADLAVLSRLYADLYALLAQWSRWAREQIAARPEKWTEQEQEQLWADMQHLLNQTRRLGGPAQPTELD
jgi:PadR family transcriptional regulator AphA